MCWSCKNLFTQRHERIAGINNRPYLPRCYSSCNDLDAVPIYTSLLHHPKNKYLVENRRQCVIYVASSAMNQNYACTSAHMFMWWTECTHTTHSFGHWLGGNKSTSHYRHVQLRSPCAHKVLNEMLEKIERFYTRILKKSPTWSETVLNTRIIALLVYMTKHEHWYEADRCDWLADYWLCQYRQDWQTCWLTDHGRVITVQQGIWQ